MEPTLEGDGHAAAGPGGLLAVARDRTLSAGEFEADMPDELGSIQFHSWDGDDHLFVITGEWGHAKNFASLPSLLPQPSEGVSAQEFGAYSDEGMSLHRLSLSTGELSTLLTLSGIERFAGPAIRFGQELIFDHHRLSSFGTEQQLGVARMDQGRAVPLHRRPGFFLSAAPSPDGSSLALVHSDIEGPFPWWWRLALHNSDEDIDYLLPETLHLTASIGWSADGRKLFVGALDGIRTGIVEVDIQDRHWRWLVQPEGTYRPFVVAPDGVTVLAVWRSCASPPRLVIVEKDERRPIPSDSPTGREAQQRLVQYPVSGGVLEGILATPSGDPPFPIVIDVHGGPLFELRDELRPELDAWVERGFAAFTPEYRSSGTLGKEQMLDNIWRGPPDRGGDIEDVLAAVDHLVEGGIADPERLYLVGFSYGARVVNWLVTVDHRFKAAVSHDGLVDVELGYKTHGGNDFFRRLLGGSPWQVPEGFGGYSISNFAHRVKTPMLLIYGDTVFSTQGISWLSALKESGVEAKLFVYRGEGHLLQREENRRDFYDRAANWFRAHS